MKQAPYNDRITYAGIRTFGGLVNPDRATDGDIVDMENLSSEHYPVLAPAKRGKIVATKESSRSALGYLDEKLYYINGDGFYYDGERITTVTGGDKTVLQFPGKLVILPDKIMIRLDVKYYRADVNNYVYEVTGMFDDETPVDIIAVVNNGGGFSEISPKPSAKKDGDLFIHNRNKSGSIAGAAVVNQVYKWDAAGKEWVEAGEPKQSALYRLKKITAVRLEKSITAKNKKISVHECDSEGNRPGDKGYLGDGLYLKIVFEDLDHNLKDSFEPGDYIKILGVGTGGEGDALITGGMVVAKTDTDYIVFENPQDAYVHSYNTLASAGISLKSMYPDFDGVFVHNNRLWGWKGSTIYASSLGEPNKIFNYSLSSTSPWSVDTLGDKICAGISYDGYPVFFKRNSVIKVYGDTASEFSTRESECTGMGIDTASRRSLAVCSGYIMYNSPKGIMKYNGSYPAYIGDGVSHLISEGGIGASDGQKYYLSFPGDKTLVFDALTGLWLKKTATYSVFYKLGGSLLGLYNDTHYPDTYDGDVELISGETPFGDGFEIFSYEENVPSCAEFAYITEGTLFRKTYNRLRVRLQVFTGKVEILASYDDSKPRVVLSVESDKTPEREIKCVDLLVQRCDTLKLYVHGTGDYRIYSIDREFTVDNDEI